MKFNKIAILILLSIFGCLACQKKNPVVEIQTPKGKILVELDLEHAPITAGNFLELVKEGFYDGSSFYRTVRASDKANPIPITVIQGGVRDNQSSRKVEPIAHETTEMTGIKHLDGTISMARRGPGTAATEFFICLGDNPELDYGGRRNPDGQGFAAFGHVTEGFRELQAIWGAPAIGENIDPPIRIHKIKLQ